MQRQAIPQTHFLLGLRNLINAVKKLQTARHPRLCTLLQNYNGEMKYHHLSHDICKGYALSFTRNMTTEATDYFQQQYQAIAAHALDHLLDMQSWVLANQARVTQLLMFGDELMKNHRIRTVKPDYFASNYQFFGLSHEAAITVNLQPHELEGMLTRHVLPYFPLVNPDTPHQLGSLLISNGNHSMSVNIRFCSGSIQYRLNDVNNTFSKETTSVAELCKYLNERFELTHRYDGDCVSYTINILTEKSDPVFDSILQRLEEHARSMPEHLPGDPVAQVGKPVYMRNLSSKKLLEKLIGNYYKGQSKVGFLQDLLLYFTDAKLAAGRTYAAPLAAEIRAYLATKPALMQNVLEEYKHNINQCSRNGYSWLHQAVMTHEVYVSWWLLRQYHANPNLHPLEPHPLINPGQAGAKGAQGVMRGTGADENRLTLDQEVQVMQTYFTHSFPAHYAVILDDLDLFDMLRDSGADMDLPGGTGHSANDIVRQGGVIHSYLQQHPAVLAPRPAEQEMTTIASSADSTEADNSTRAFGLLLFGSSKATLPGNHQSHRPSQRSSKW